MVYYTFLKWGMCWLKRRSCSISMSYNRSFSTKVIKLGIAIMFTGFLGIMWETNIYYNWDCLKTSSLSSSSISDWYRKTDSSINHLYEFQKWKWLCITKFSALTLLLFQIGPFWYWNTMPHRHLHIFLPYSQIVLSWRSSSCTNQILYFRWFVVVAPLMYRSEALMCLFLMVDGNVWFWLKHNYPSAYNVYR
jgi:hypothetical protein